MEPRSTLEPAWLATAVARTSVIVNFSVKLFPTDSCESYKLEAQHLDVFAEHLVNLDLGMARRVVEEVSGRTTRPYLQLQRSSIACAVISPNAMARVAGT